MIGLHLENKIENPALWEVPVDELPDFGDYIESVDIKDWWTVRSLILFYNKISKLKRNNDFDRGEYLLLGETMGEILKLEEVLNIDFEDIVVSKIQPEFTLEDFEIFFETHLGHILVGNVMVGAWLTKQFQSKSQKHKILLCLSYLTSLSNILMQYNEEEETEDDEKYANDLIGELSKTQGLVDSILSAWENYADMDLKPKLLKLYVIQRVFGHPNSTGTWLVERLSTGSPIEQKRVIDYFEVLSHLDVDFSNSVVSDLYEETVKNISNLPYLLAAMLRLKSKMQSKMLHHGFVINLIDDKLSAPMAVIVLLLDGLFVIILYILLYFAMDQSIDNPTLEAPESYLLISSLIPCVYILAREIVQSYFMRKINLLSTYINDWWNRLDLLVGLSVPIFIAITFSSKSARMTDAYKITSSIIFLLIFVKILGFLSVLNQNFATFILSLIQIIADIIPFVIVIMSATFTFAVMFHFVLDNGRIYGSVTNETSESSENDHNLGFSNGIYRSILTAFRMMLGDFEREWFDTESLILSFYTEILSMIHSFFVLVIIFNVLIAVVSDSYDYSMTRSRTLYLKARLELTGEFDALHLTTQKPHWKTINYLLGPMIKKLRITPEDETDGEEDNWKGRALDMESRIKTVIEKRCKKLEEQLMQQMIDMEQRMHESIKNEKKKKIDIKLEQLLIRKWNQRFAIMLYIENPAKFPNKF